MKTRILTVAILTALLSIVAHAQNAPQAERVVTTAPGLVLATEAVQVQGQIKSIDTKTRSVVVLSEKGNEFTVAAGEDTRNFEQLRIGDIVTLTHAQALTLELQKVSGKVVSERVESEQALRTKLGEKPGAIIRRSIRIIAEVMAVDSAEKSVKLRGPNRTVDLTVNDPEQLKEIKTGDQIEAVYLEAVGIEVTAAPKTK